MCSSHSVGPHKIIASGMGCSESCACRETHIQTELPTPTMILWGPTLLSNVMKRTCTPDLNDFLTIVDTKFTNIQKHCYMSYWSFIAITLSLLWLHKILLQEFCKEQLQWVHAYDRGLPCPHLLVSTHFKPHIIVLRVELYSISKSIGHLHSIILTVMGSPSWHYLANELCLANLTSYLV
jgi:hypothetical protein